MARAIRGVAGRPRLFAEAIVEQYGERERAGASINRPIDRCSRSLTLPVLFRSLNPQCIRGCLSALLPAARRFYFGRAVDEVRHVPMQLLARVLLDVHHVAGFVIGEADVLSD